MGRANHGDTELNKKVLDNRAFVVHFVPSWFVSSRLDPAWLLLLAGCIYSAARGLLPLTQSDSGVSEGL